MDLICFFIGLIVGIIIYDKRDKKQLYDEFNRGYDWCLDSMTKYGYWHEPNCGPRHYGTWVPKEEKNEENV